MTSQLYAIATTLSSFFRRHHPIIFVLLIGLSLSCEVYLIYNVLELSSVPTVGNASKVAGFDQKTIDKIKQLRDSDNSDTTIELPSPRPNPFIE